ncbi:hypothetical protein [uncultured Sphingomonas sp.]|uniref:hypothetical protein n=1 Tax=uncultured Sphingomonas sp. TaxID=158754 RepID=UPI0035CC56A8
MCATGLASCSVAPGPRDDVQRINDSLLALLTSDGRRICVDAKTYGEPLGIFRTMLPAPDPAKRPLGWFPPRPLEFGPSLGARQLVDVELRGERVVLPERSQPRDRLPVTRQVQLNSLAADGALMTPHGSTSFRSNPAAPRATVRWWPLNRFDSKCGPVYTFSKPVVFRGAAFVTVTAGHRGSTYAFSESGAGWAPVAKWSTWLY